MPSLKVVELAFLYPVIMALVFFMFQITLGLSSSTLAATTFNGEYTFDENKSYAGYIVGANASGTLNIGTKIVASVSDASSSVIGQGTNGRGTVNVYDGGFWDLVDHRYGADSPLSLNIGQDVTSGWQPGAVAKPLNPFAVPADSALPIVHG